MQIARPKEVLKFWSVELFEVVLLVNFLFSKQSLGLQHSFVNTFFVFSFLASG